MPKKPESLTKVEVFLIDKKKHEYKIVRDDCRQIHVYGYKKALATARRYFRDGCIRLKAMGAVSDSRW